jgi:hypothetical protein
MSQAQKLPESVTIITGNGTARNLEVDGSPFPWYISADDPIRVEFNEDHLATVNLTFIAEAGTITTREDKP